MTAVAERSGSSIGALYNYFPDKRSIAFTLVNRYFQEMEAHWKPLIEQAELLTHAEFADLFIARTPNSCRRVPLFEPAGRTRSHSPRPCCPKSYANRNRKCVSAKNPSLSKEQSLLAANVSLQMVAGMMTLYGEADAEGKVLVVAEFKKVLTFYLGSVLSG